MEWNNRNFTVDSVVKLDDYVYFELPDFRIVRYHVCSRYLSRPGDELEVFKILGIDAVEFCSNVVGYPCRDAGPGFWPEIKHEDYNELSAIIYAIFQELNKLAVPPKFIKLSTIDVII